MNHNGMLVPTSFFNIAAPFLPSRHVMLIMVMCFPSVGVIWKDVIGWCTSNFATNGSVSSRSSHSNRILVTRRQQPSAFPMHHTICHRFERDYDAPPNLSPMVACHLMLATQIESWWQGDNNHHLARWITPFFTDLREMMTHLQICHK